MVRAYSRAMRFIVLGSLLLLGGASGEGGLWASDPSFNAHSAASINVNSRYIVEAVDLNGYSQAKVSDAVRDRIQAMIGQPYDSEAIDGVAKELRKELHAKAVTQHLAKGSNPDMVRLVYEVTRRTAGLDISVPKFLYHSKQGWSGEVDASTTLAKYHTLTFGIVSDNDELIERYSGIKASYENTHVGSDKVRFRFLFENFHEGWNQLTSNVESAQAIQPVKDSMEPETYRMRRNYEPLFSFAVAKSLTLTTGASLQSLSEVLPGVRTESSNALIFGFRYHKQVGGTEDALRVFDSSYDLRTATKAIGSDYVYTRQHWVTAFNWSKGRHAVSDVVTAGYITGRAPLYERFVVGTSSLLRGWNRYEIDPLGGTRLLHNSVEYRYRFLQAFYDCGSLSSNTKAATLRHSLGIGIRQNIFSVALAFPVRTDGRVEPTLLVGMNY
jgi:Omp85 superfamily domain